MTATSLQPVSRRRICSYDIIEVPAEYYLLREAAGDMYFCNPRCLCIWAVLFATKPNRTRAQDALAVEMTTPSGHRRKFANALELARWAAANLLKGEQNPWIEAGTELANGNVVKVTERE